MKKRYELIDLWRTAALITMLAYHFIYDLGTFGFITRAQVFSFWPQALQRFTCYSFIIISGISCRFSHSNARRGLMTFSCGVVVGIIASRSGLPIRFGILHLLGISMLVYAAVEKPLRRIPGFVAPVLWLGLFVALKLLIARAPEVESKFLFPFGLVYPGFFSSDYFPIFPWLFLFLAGTWLGGQIADDKLPWLSAPIPRQLTWPGRHTLVIYMAHQPILYGICWLFAQFFQNS